METTNLTAIEIANNIKNGKLTCKSVFNAFKSRITRFNGDVGAFLLTEDKPRKASSNGLLAGVPVAVKDNICTEWLPTTAASKILKNYRPIFNATVVDRILAAGAQVIGKVNMDEFGMGSTTEFSAFFPTGNPRDLRLSPGGSSGGSAAAVASGMAPLALGSDTGGSIRQPCAMCGTVGIKTTYGRTSRYGLISFSPSFDQIGPLGRNVKDVALLTQVIAGYDPKEATSIDKPVPDYINGLESDTGRLKIALINEFFDESIDDDVRDGIENGLTALERMGHTITRASFPNAALALPTYFVAGCAETYSNLARYDGVLFAERPDEYRGMRDMIAGARGAGFGPEVMRRITAGAYVLSVGYQDQYYSKAQILRRFLRGRFDEIFEEYDFIVSPVSPFTAFELGDKVKDIQQLYLADIYTSLANLVGIPALAMPCEMTPKPVGFQIFARRWDEERLFALAYQLEKELRLDLSPVDPK
jgi:aspartyl-tRNA(Asn)/glutamyl-tRNA(Gln) amidotransferase subunit A